MEDEDLIPVEWQELRRVIRLLAEVAEILAGVVESLEDAETTGPILRLVKKDDEGTDR